jgi:RNA polymerase sigma-70 factor (ECF subfamily)
MKEATESEILGAMQANLIGPQAAPDQLMRLMTDHERPLFAYLYSLLRDVSAVRDCLQDTFLRAYLHLRDGRPIETAWLYRVAHNRAMDEYRRRWPVWSAGEEPVQLYDPTGRRLEVQEALDELPALDREVLFLHCYVGFKTDEIAERLGISGAAVRQRLYRARDRFRTVYQADV